MTLLALTLSLLANHGAIYVYADTIELPEGQLPLWKAEELHALVENRCPAEMRDFLDTNPDGLSLPTYELPPSQDRAVRLLWRDWNLLFGDQFEHFMAFVLITSAQASTYLAYEEYLETGESTYFEGSRGPVELRTEFATWTALMTCMYPTDREIGWDVHALLWPKILEPLECTRWLEMSGGVLDLDVAKAGTPEMNEQLVAVLEGTIGQCEKDKT